MDRKKEQSGFRRTEYQCGPEGRRIFGLLYRPEGIAHPPLIIFPHEMGRTHSSVAGLVLLYPGFILIEDLHRDYGSLDRVPENFVFNGWFPVGRRFAADVWDFDPYSQIGRYDKPVLVLHGDSDPLHPAVSGADWRRRPAGSGEGRRARMKPAAEFFAGAGIRSGSTATFPD